MLAVDRPEVAGLHLAVAGASGLDRRLVHGLDATRADRGQLGLVDRREQADESLSQLRQPRPADPDAGGTEALMLAVKRDVPREFIHQQPSAEADIRSAALQDPVRGRQSEDLPAGFELDDG